MVFLPRLALFAPKTVTVLEDPTCVGRLATTPFWPAGGHKLEVKTRTGELSLSQVPADTATLSDPPSPEDVGLFLHTSGTTSRPKGVPLTQANLVASIANIVDVSVCVCVVVAVVCVGRWGVL